MEASSVELIYWSSLFVNTPLWEHVGCTTMTHVAVSTVILLTGLTQERSAWNTSIFVVSKGH